MAPGMKMRSEQQDLPNSKTSLHSEGSIHHYTSGTYSHGGMMDYARFQISELHLGKFPDSMNFPSWKVNFKTDVCAKTTNPQVTMSWITDVEQAKSIDELKTSRSNSPDGVSIEEDSQLGNQIPEKNNNRRARRSEGRSILTRETDCIYDR